MYDFASAAFPWVALGIALAVTLTYMDKSKNTKKDNK